MEPEYNPESSEDQEELNDGDNTLSISINSDNNDEENSSFSNLELNESEDFFISEEEWNLEEIVYENQPFKPNTTPIYNKVIQPALNKNFLEELSKIPEKEITPKYFFRKIVDNELLLKISKFTNEYFHKNIEPNISLKIKSHKKKWVDVSIEDIYKYFLLNIYFGTIKLPSYKMNWSKNKYLNQLWVGENFSIDRFNEIHRAIKYSSKSFTSNEKEDKYKDFLHAIIVNSNKLYQASNQKSIDESMVRFQGRAKHLFYMKFKTIKIY